MPNNQAQAASRTSGSSVYNSADQAAAKARGVQSGTTSARQQQAPATERRSPQVPSSEHLLMPEMAGVPAEAWGRDLGYCHGAPAALVGTVGLEGDLPPMPAYRCFLPLRRHRLRTIAASLARKGFQLDGFCLLRCSESCGFSCSRPVAFETRRGHANHQSPSCHP